MRADKLAALEALRLDAAQLAAPGTDEYKTAVREAYAAAVKASHPDTGSGDRLDWDKLREAKQLLLSDSLPCKVCGGTGRVQSGWFIGTCPACRGTGERND